LMTPQMAIEKLIAGGFISGEAEDVISMIEAIPLPMLQTVQNSVQ